MAGNTIGQLFRVTTFGESHGLALGCIVDGVPPGIHTLDGETVTLASISEERPVLLYFWASWCGICRFTTPDVARLQSEGESVMTIALRSGNDGEVSRWLSRKRVTFPVVNDSGGEISRNWEISVTPTLVVVSKGQVVTTTSGWTSYWGMKLRLWRAAMF